VFNPGYLHYLGYFKMTIIQYLYSAIKSEDAEALNHMDIVSYHKLN